MFDTDALHVFEHADRVSTMNEEDAVAGTQNDLTKTQAVFIKEINSHYAALHDKHLLQIVDYSIDGFVIMSRFNETGFVGQQAKLER